VRGLPPLFALAFLLPGLAGCLGEDAAPAAAPVPLGAPLSPLPADVRAGLDLLEDRMAAPPALDQEATVNVVLVGIDPGWIDAEALRAALPADYSPKIDFSHPREGLRSGIVHRIRYEVHEAPAAFADALFSQYPTLSREVEAPGGDSGFLARYDAMYDLGRLESGKVHLVDARRVEDWIEANRGAHGLRFPGPERTVFLLDSWTRHKLWADSYYWYAFEEDGEESEGSRDMRAWGGTHGFLFMDWSAAPNDSGTDDSGYATVDYLLGSLPVYAPEGTAYNDPPTWHYGPDGVATIGKGPAQKRVTMTERAVHALDVAVSLRLFGDYLFRPAYAETYHVNVHLWHDGRSQVPTDALDGLLDREALQRDLQAQMPWTEVRVWLTTYVAPRDDPGMDRVLTLAKAEGADGMLPLARLLQHVDAHPEKYKKSDPHGFDVMALLFVLEGHYAVVVPGVAGGVAVLGPDGIGWGALTSVNDAVFLAQGRDLDRISMRMTRTNAHELGHFFGLPHAHDGTRRTADGYEPFLDHTWSSTNTVMSYRVAPATTDALHRELLARAHALDNLERLTRDAQSAYRALQARGLDQAPPAVLARLQEAAAGHDEALRLYSEGRWEDAAYAAVAAGRSARSAMHEAGVRWQDETVARWSATGVTSAGVKPAAFVFQAGVAPTGVRLDYRPVAIPHDADRLTVRAFWNNTPASWGDFLVGWRVQDFLTVLPGTPLDGFVSLRQGVHDEAEEGPTDGAVVRSFSLDLDTFPLLRGREVHLGAGTMGMAVNGAYEVEVVVERRIHGE
jgi:hypothetical protein